MEKVMDQTQKDQNKLRTREMVGYAFGNTAQNMVYLMISLYLLYFYTDVFGISAALAGTLFLVARIFDGLYDPFIGYIADRTETKWGKFRPYILFGMIPLAIVTILLFSTPDFNDSGKVVYAYVTYLLHGIIFSLVLIPFFSLPAVMTQDPQERSKISVMNLLMSTISAVLVAVAVKPIVAMFPNEKTGFQFTTGIFMVIAVVAFYICYRSTKERVNIKNRAKYRFRTIFKLIFTNKPLMLISVSYIFFSIQYTLRMASATYYAKYNLENEALTPIILLVATVFSLAGFVLCFPLLKKYGKRKTYIIGAAVAIITNIILYFIPYSSVGMIVVIISINSLALALPLAATWAMVPDTVDWGEWKTGFRAEGATFGAFSFVQQLASAIAGALAGFILTFVGYVPNAVQTPAARAGISHMLTTIPAVCNIICIVIILFYSLSEKKVIEIVKETNAKREA